MDLLKKAYTNLENCSVDGNTVLIGGEQYDANKIVSFPTKKAKEYTLGSALFFLMNSKKSIKDYIGLCKERNIVSISHIDKANILKDVENYESKSIPGFFVGSGYEAKRSYDIPIIKNRDIIILSTGLTSKIHVDNIEKLLLDGVYEASTNNPLSRQELSINLFGKKYTVYKNTESLEKEDWDRIKAIFIEKLATQEAQDTLQKCPKDVHVFTLEQEHIKSSIKLDIRGGILKNHEKVLDCFKN